MIQDTGLKNSQDKHYQENFIFILSAWLHPPKQGTGRQSPNREQWSHLGKDSGT